MDATEAPDHIHSGGMPRGRNCDTVIDFWLPLIIKMFREAAETKRQKEKL